MNEWYYLQVVMVAETSIGPFHNLLELGTEKKKET